MSLAARVAALAGAIADALNVRSYSSLITASTGYTVTSQSVQRFGKLVVVAATIEGSFPAEAHRWCAVLSALNGLRPPAQVTGSAVVSSGSDYRTGSGLLGSSGALAVTVGPNAGTTARVAFVYFLA